MSAGKTLEKIIKMDNEILELQDQFDKESESSKEEALVSLYSSLQKSTGDSDVLPHSLMRITEMVCGLENASAVLATGLSHKNDDFRHLAGEGLIMVGTEEGVDALVPAVDHAVEKGDVSALELPLILAEIDDPASAAQIHRFLDLEDTGIVYSAIEACASLEDPESVEPLRKLVDDTREIEVDDDDDDEPITIGMLAREAIDLLEAEVE